MQVESGAIVEGTVTRITNFGAFVKLPTNEIGLVHISEVSREYIQDIRDALSEGQEVKVKVLDVTGQGKISLSIKGALPEDKFRKNAPRRQPNVWQGPKSAESGGDLSFEDMMSVFKKTSDERISDLKRSSDSRRSKGKR